MGGSLCTVNGVRAQPTKENAKNVENEKNTEKYRKCRQ